jgi:hypothetical protein
MNLNQILLQMRKFENQAPANKTDKKFYDKLVNPSIIFNEFNPKPSTFFSFDCDYYRKRTIHLEAEIKDFIQRRMIPDANYIVNSKVNTYNTFTCDDMEYSCLIIHLLNSSSCFSYKYKSVRIKDRGIEAGNPRKGEVIMYQWKNDEENGNYLPTLASDPYWFVTKWENKKYLWESLLLNLILVYKKEEHRMRVEIEYKVFKYEKEWIMQ